MYNVVDSHIFSKGAITKLRASKAQQNHAKLQQEQPNGAQASEDS
jgi:hypothetical protein